jgi:hypothetical protein
VRFKINLTNEFFLTILKTISQKNWNKISYGKFELYLHLKSKPFTVEPLVESFRTLCDHSHSPDSGKSLDLSPCFICSTLVDSCITFSNPFQGGRYLKSGRGRDLFLVIESYISTPLSINISEDQKKCLYWGIFSMERLWQKF